MGFSKKYHNDMMKRAKLKQDQCNKHEWITIMGDKICKKCGSRPSAALTIERQISPLRDALPEPCMSPAFG